MPLHALSSDAKLNPSNLVQCEVSFSFFFLSLCKCTLGGPFITAVAFIQHVSELGLNSTKECDYGTIHLAVIAELLGRLRAAICE